MITREKLENFLGHAVELEDCNKHIVKGWFIKTEPKLYSIFPLDDIWRVYGFRLSHIKRIKFLTNGFEIK